MPRQKNVYISLENSQRHDNKLVLAINDDGKGFDKNKTRKGMGLSGIQERVDSMGGEFLLVTDVDNGVNITIILPVQPIETTDAQVESPTDDITE